MSSSNYSIMRRVSKCKQDATVELSVLLTVVHTFFFRDKGEDAQKRPRGGTTVTACCVENIILLSLP